MKFKLSNSIRINEDSTETAEEREEALEEFNLQYGNEYDPTNLTQCLNEAYEENLTNIALSKANARESGNKTDLRRDMRLNLLVWSPPGFGKTGIITTWAAKHDKVLLFETQGPSLIPELVQGVPSKMEASEQASRKFEFLSSGYFDALNTKGYRCILFIDEMNRAYPEGINTILGLVNNRVVPDSSEPSKVKYMDHMLMTIAACNPPKDSDDGIHQLGEAASSRFVIVDFVPNPKELHDYLSNKMQRKFRTDIDGMRNALKEYYEDAILKDPDDIDYIDKNDEDLKRIYNASLNEAATMAYNAGWIQPLVDVFTSQTAIDAMVEQSEEDRDRDDYKKGLLNPRNVELFLNSFLSRYVITGNSVLKRAEVQLNIGPRSTGKSFEVFDALKQATLKFEKHTNELESKIRKEYARIHDPNFEARYAEEEDDDDDDYDDEQQEINGETELSLDNVELDGEQEIGIYSDPDNIFNALTKSSASNKTEKEVEANNKEKQLSLFDNEDR